MKVDEVHLYKICYSNSAIEDEMNQLQAQMQDKNPTSPEYLYDQINLEMEACQLETREQHPDLDPLSLTQSDEIDKLVDQNTDFIELEKAARELALAYPSESPKWGIPMSAETHVIYRID